MYYLMACSTLHISQDWCTQVRKRRRTSRGGEIDRDIIRGQLTRLVPTNNLRKAQLDRWIDCLKVGNFSRRGRSVEGKQPSPRSMAPAIRRSIHVTIKWVAETDDKRDYWSDGLSDWTAINKIILDFNYDSRRPPSLVYIWVGIILDKSIKISWAHMAFLSAIPSSHYKEDQVRCKG